MTDIFDIISEREISKQDLTLQAAYDYRENQWVSLYSSNYDDIILIEYSYHFIEHYSIELHQSKIILVRRFDKGKLNIDNLMTANTRKVIQQFISNPDNNVLILNMTNTKPKPIVYTEKFKIDDEQQDCLQSILRHELNSFAFAEEVETIIYGSVKNMFNKLKVYEYADVEGQIESKHKLQQEMIQDQHNYEDRYLLEMEMNSRKRTLD